MAQNRTKTTPVAPRKPSLSSSSMRIYPDIESQRTAHPTPEEEKAMKPTAPLMPKNPAPYQRENVSYVYPREQRPPPSVRPQRKKRGCSCCRFIGCLCCLLLVLLVVIGILVGAFFWAFQPRLPKYSVDNLRITEFNVNTDLSLSAALSVDVTARNPNKKIGIYYLDDSHISVWYSGVRMCQGSIPPFYQGHKNTTELVLSLQGNNVTVTSDMVSSLKEQQGEGKIPLHLKADVPVKVKAGSIKSMKVTIKLRCDLVVDRLAANADIKLRDTHCHVKV